MTNQRVGARDACASKNVSQCGVYPFVKCLTVCNLVLFALKIEHIHVDCLKNNQGDTISIDILDH